jgi:Mce-associated membrane protein
MTAEHPDTDDALVRAVVSDEDSEAAPVDPQPKAEAPARRWPQTVAVAVAALLTGVCLAVAGLMVWQHRAIAAERAVEQRFVDAARDGVTALLSMDHTRAQADVQRVLDLSTGPFHDDFQRTAEDFVKTAVDSKAVTTGTINAAALDRLEGDRATVLVAATSEVTNANGANADARPFRISVTVDRAADSFKMSEVEFVP